MFWLLLTALAVLCRAIYGVLTKVMSNKFSGTAYTQASILSLAGLIIALLLSPFIGGMHMTGHLNLWALCLIMVSQGLGNIIYFAAIKSLTNGTAQIAFSSTLLFNTLLSFLLLSLHLSFLNAFGLVLLLLAILSVVSGKIELNKRGILLMVLSAFFFSVFQTTSATLSKQLTPAAYLAAAFFGSTLFVFLWKYNVIVKDIRRHHWKTTLFVPVITVIPSLAYYLFAYYAFRAAPQPAKVAMLLPSQVVITVFLGYIFLHEKGLVWRKLLAAILVVISALLIKS
jgi:drug/metabolite transporter (DMT)-like permease